MTGIASDGSYTYVLGDNYSSIPYVEYFNSSGVVQNSPYMQDPEALANHFDIAYEGSNGSGDIWVADDGAESPIKAYDTGGNLVAYVPGTDLPDGAEIRGLTFDSEGYLWASDLNADKIYQIDITTGTAGETGAGLAGFGLSLSSNPFHGAVNISVNGTAGPVELAVYDMAGRTVLRQTVESGGSMCWNGSGVPSGTYMVRATAPDGTATSRMVTRL